MNTYVKTHNVSRVDYLLWIETQLGRTIKMEEVPVLELCYSRGDHPEWCVLKLEANDNK